jgi:hypothetical protein
VVPRGAQRAGGCSAGFTLARRWRMSPILRACPKCGVRVAPPDRYCPIHKAEDNRRRAKKVREYGYGSPHWKRIRAARLALADQICELRIRCNGAKATHVYLDPVLRGEHYRARIEDTRACCAPCSGAVDAPRSHGAH